MKTTKKSFLISPKKIESTFFINAIKVDRKVTRNWRSREINSTRCRHFWDVTFSAFVFLARLAFAVRALATTQIAFLLSVLMIIFTSGDRHPPRNYDPPEDLSLLCRKGYCHAERNIINPSILLYNGIRSSNQTDESLTVVISRLFVRYKDRLIIGDRYFAFPFFSCI